MTSSKMRVALVCDWLTTPGGAEKVLLDLHKMYPEAPIYTSQYRPKKINWFKSADVRTGWLNIIPAALRRYIGPLRQLYFSHLDLSSYDLVISVTGAEAKAVRTTPKSSKQQKGPTAPKIPKNKTKSSKKHPNPSLYHTSSEKSIGGAKHLCYCHVPTQYYWQMYDQYLENPGFGVFNPLARLGLRLLVKPLRRADFASSQKVDQFVTISQYSANQIKTYYHRDALVVSPSVDIEQFARRESPQKLSTDFSTAQHPVSAKHPPFIISCRQVTWKRVDLAIAACLKDQRPLWVIGDGPEHSHLVKLAENSPLIRFIPWLSAPELATYLQNSAGYIFPSMEPFGIAAVEALAAGCPVIAYAAGGSRDFVIPEQNGLLFPEQTVDSLVQAIHQFDKYQFNPDTIAATAAKYSPRHFRQGINRVIHRLMTGSSKSKSQTSPDSEAHS